MTVTDIQNEFARLTILVGAQRQTLTLSRGLTTIGRSPEADIMLVQPALAPLHCLIRREGSRCWVESLAGKTFVNGRELTRRIELRSGDLLSLEEVSLLYDADQHERDHGTVSLPMVVNGRRATDIPVAAGRHRVGSHPACEVILPSPEIAPIHATLEGVGKEGLRILATHDQGECRINGLYFEEHAAVYGDQVDFGPYRFFYDGRALRLSKAQTDISLSAETVSVRQRKRVLLHEISLKIRSREFVGIIGPTGAGKSTCLRALNGLRRPSSGRVLIENRDLYANLDGFRQVLGWVPQQDIVHRELSVRQALTFAARLRLPRGAPGREINRLVQRTAAKLGLEKQLDMAVGSLSGGETKKVNVAAELLCQPQILFLDEPTSGLDPGAQSKLMDLLRQLANSGCTVVCTTHTMQNLYLLDQVVVLSEGKRVFSGDSHELRRFFGVMEAGGVFARLDERPAQEWRQSYEAGFSKPENSKPENAAQPPTENGIQPPNNRKLRIHRFRTSNQLPLLILRQAAILLADWRNPLILAAQPVLIGALLGWAVNGTVDDSALKLFFASIATLWFGCSNGAQEIVGELPIYRRERMVGLRRTSYIISKWVFTAIITLLQAALLYLVARLSGDGIDGSMVWQIAGLAAMSSLASFFGLAISAVSGSATQAVLLVPLFIIPQIVLSGYTVPASVMAPVVMRFSEVMPAFQLQRIMDVSLVWQRKVEPALLEDHLQAFRNVTKQNELKVGDVFHSTRPARQALRIAGLWLLLSYFCMVVALRFKERNA